MSSTPPNAVLSDDLPFAPASQANDTYQSNDADFTIHSADGLAFKVHKYQLMAASTVFRAMLSGCGANSTSSSQYSSTLNLADISTDELKLSDNQIERCHSIRLFLDLIYGRVLDPPSSSFHKYLNVGTLLKKYDCEAPLQAWKWALRAWSTDYDACTMTTFVCAANLDEIGTMVNLIATKSSTWAKKGEKDSDDDSHKAGGAGGTYNKVLKTAVTGHLVLDLTSARQDFFEAIPIVYSMALLRASRIGSETGVLDKKSRVRV